MSVQPSIDWLAIISLLGTGQGFFLGIIFLYTPAGNRTANRILGIMLLTQSLSILEVVLCYTDLIHYAPFFVNATEPLDFALGPLLFLYVLTLLKPNFRLRSVHLLHFIAPFVYAIYMIPYYLQSNAFKLRAVALDYHKPYQIEATIKPVLWFPDSFRNSTFVDLVDTLIIFPYLLVTLAAIYQYTRKQKQSVSARPIIKWLSTVAIYFTAIILVATYLSFSSEGDLGDIYIAAAMSLINYGISFHVITQSQLLNVAATNAEPAKKKYAKSSLNSEDTDMYKQQLLEYMHVHKPYLAADLTMPQLAEKLRLSSHQLSQVINEQLGQSFYDFIQ
jgi:hypothetical protein